MKLYPHILSAFVVLAAMTVPSAYSQVTVNSFPKLSEISSEAICRMIPVAEAVQTGIDSMHRLPAGKKLPMPFNLTGEDFVTKVYGLFDPKLSGTELRQACKSVLELLPDYDNMGLWLQTDDGYSLNYYGIQPPEVTTMARLESDSITDFGFFFLFPYSASDQEEINGRQAEFCGSLLQELYDLGVVLGVNTMSDDLFDVSGEYKGNFVAIRLIDDPLPAKENATGRKDAVAGRYILMLSVEPGGFVDEDSIAVL